MTGINYKQMSSIAAWLISSNIVWIVTLRIKCDFNKFKLFRVLATYVFVFLFFYSFFMYLVKSWLYIDVLKSRLCTVYIVQFISAKLTAACRTVLLFTLINQRIVWVRKKQCTWLLIITSANVDRFLKFLHYQIPEKTVYVLTITRSSTLP